MLIVHFGWGSAAYAPADRWQPVPSGNLYVRFNV